MLQCAAATKSRCTAVHLHVCVCVCESERVCEGVATTTSCCTAARLCVYVCGGWGCMGVRLLQMRGSLLQCVVATIPHCMAVRLYVRESVCECVAVCYSVLQCVAVCCSVLQCVAVCCSALQCVAVRCNVSQPQRLVTGDAPVRVCKRDSV